MAYNAPQKQRSPRFDVGSYGRAFRRLSGWPVKSGRGGTTRAEVTTAVHWLRLTGRGVLPVEVAGRIATYLRESVEVRERGRYTYASSLHVGPVVVYYSEGRNDVCVDVPGSACEELGAAGLLWFMDWQNGDAEDWRATRVDLALDGVPFDPATLHQAWVAGNVRTRVKAPDDARADREGVRRCEWSEHPTGDLFGMGARVSEQYARCYDRRGPARFELELKGKTAVAVLPEIRSRLAAKHGRALGPYVVGLVRRFVDFVDAESDTNASRRELLDWWLAFVRGARKVRVEFPPRVERDGSDVLDWMHGSVGPMLGIVRRVFGGDVLLALARDGETRFRKRHRRILELSGVPYGAPS